MQNQKLNQYNNIVYTENVVKTSFICYFILTAENLIWLVVF